MKHESTIFQAPYCDYIENMIEMHIGLKEREDDRDENDDTFKMYLKIYYIDKYADS